MGREKSVGLLVALAIVAWPTSGWTQSVASGSIAGIVRDTTGAVLPGVTVEASSPALIEKVRSVVTDAQGNYKIVDLRPGAYTVTFTLPGFATYRREGIELSPRSDDELARKVGRSRPHISNGQVHLLPQ